MAKSLFGGGAVLTGALLLSSLAVNVHPSVAENLASLDSIQQTQEKTNPAATSLSGETATSAVAKIAAEASTNPDIASALKPGVGTTAPAVAANASDATPATVQSFTATAYSLGGRTASGATVRRGLIAADHRVLPLGSRVRVEAGSYTGEYLVADRGSAVRGRIIDIWVPSSHEAMRFGRRPVRVTVLSYGAARPTAWARVRRR
ncbi:MAG: 3D domain-containing protein [Pyrinomonadaceae bacterium]